MLTEQIAKALKKTQIVTRSNSRFIGADEKKLENYLMELQNVLQEVKLPDDCFDDWSRHAYSRAYGNEVNLLEITFKGKNYEIIIATSEPDDGHKDDQKSKTFQVLGFGIKQEEWDKIDLDIFKNIAQQTNSKFNFIAPSKLQPYNQRLMSDIIDLQAEPHQICNLSWIVKNIQKGTMACEKYVRERQDYIQNKAKRLIFELNSVSNNEPI
jgi:hypothetical protein